MTAYPRAPIWLCCPDCGQYVSHSDGDADCADCGWAGSTDDCDPDAEHDTDQVVSREAHLAKRAAPDALGPAMLTVCEAAGALAEERAARARHTGVSWSTAAEIHLLAAAIREHLGEES